MTHFLQVRNLTAFRQQRPLFKLLNFDLSSNHLLHITGNNGVGKSTLLMVLAGLLPLREAEIAWQNQKIGTHNYDDLLKDTFYLGHQIALKSQLTVKENLNFFKRLHPCGHTNEENLLEQLDILPLQNTLCQQLSAGQKQRVALTRLWMTQAKLWLLDEPFNSLDKASIDKVMSKLISHCQTGGLIIMTSHQDFSLPTSIVVKSIHL